MTKIKTTCTLCGEKSKSSDTPVSCPVCGVNFNNSTEVVLKKVDCISSEGAAGAATRKGILFLTNHRVFWLKRQTRLFAKGPSLYDAIFLRAKTMEFSFRLDRITDVQIAKKGPFKMFALTVGDKVIALDIKAKHRQEWIDDINNAKNNFSADTAATTT